MGAWIKDKAIVVERCQGLEGEIQLQTRGADYEIIYNGVFLMASYNGASERAAVRKALTLLSKKYHKSIRVLIGGLGMGYSLQEALAQDSVSYVAVAEIEPDIIRWNNEHFKSVNDHALDDKRVEIFNDDFLLLLEVESEKAKKNLAHSYHLVVVDTDNGSTWLSLPANSFLYEEKGLHLIKSLLHPQGIASFWSSEQEPAFESRLKKQFNQVSFNFEMEKTGQVGCYYLAGDDY